MLVSIVKMWLITKPWFWKLRIKIVNIIFLLERSIYGARTSSSKAMNRFRTFISIVWMSSKSLLGIVVLIVALSMLEGVARESKWLKSVPSEEDVEFYVEQLRLYAQVLTAIFSIYFATIGIIVSSGYTRLRRDIIQLLINEQVGNVYSRLLVSTAIFCIVAISDLLGGFEPSLFIYTVGTLLTIISLFALFPLGQRLFNFFDLSQLGRSEILPRIVRYIERAANPKNSISISNHYAKVARQAFEQLCYIDDHIKDNETRLNENLPALSDDYSDLLNFYLCNKHRIAHQSYWFPREKKHKQWFLSGDLDTQRALQTNSQLTTEEETNYQWLENEIIQRLSDHIELALRLGDFRLGLALIRKLSYRIQIYAHQFQFELGKKEIDKIQISIIESFKALDKSDESNITTLKVAIAETWAAIGSALCYETMRRMITFESEFERFLKNDVWTVESLQSLPTFLQVELALISERIAFEVTIEGSRLSRTKYVQQLAVKKLLDNYTKILPKISYFYSRDVLNFINSLNEMKMSIASTQVTLASLHNYWKLPQWFGEVSTLSDKCQKYSHYSSEDFSIPTVNAEHMIEEINSTKLKAIELLSKPEFVKHIFEHEGNDDIPDHFGQIYYELAESCVKAIEDNDDALLNKIFPMFMKLSILASDYKFLKPNLGVSTDYQLRLVSTTINDLMSVLGFAILYGSYFGNDQLSRGVLKVFQEVLDQVPDKTKYLLRMIGLSNSDRFSFAASPRELIRSNWKMAFEQRTRMDGFADQMSMQSHKEHHNKIVRAFISTRFAEASHLFIAVHLLPQLSDSDIEVAPYVRELVECMGEEY